MTQGEAGGYVETVVIGAGQAGLSTGYHLKRRDLPFLILDEHQRVGDTWRERWDSLRLFTPAAFDSLDGLQFPAPGNRFPTREEMADYLEAYADWFELPVQTGTRVERLSRENGRFVIRSGDMELTASNVVVAMSDFQKPKMPAFSAELDESILQLHSKDYRNPGQLREGAVLVVGAGNSGAEIALELAQRHTVLVSGRDTGHLPFRVDGVPARLFLRRFFLRVVFHRLLTVGTAVGRRARPKILSRGGPLIRVHPDDLARAGVERVPRMAGVRNGLPLLESGRVLDVANVIWCTGFDAGFDWIDVPGPGGGETARLDHRSGIAGSTPGLYFVGLHFLHALSSAMIHGVGRDANRVAEAIARAGRAGARGATAG